MTEEVAKALAGGWWVCRREHHITWRPSWVPGWRCGFDTMTYTCDSPVIVATPEQLAVFLLGGQEAVAAMCDTGHHDIPATGV